MSFLHDRRTFSDLIGRAPTPEFLQRIENTRRTNLAMAQRRLLDRDTYKGLRSYIRIPVNATEKARNGRWRHLHEMLGSARLGLRVHPASIATFRSTKALDPQQLLASGCLL